MSLPIVDTHCHLDLPDFDSDRDLVINRAREAGVVHFIVPGITISTGNDICKSFSDKPDFSFAFGLHPNNATEWDTGSEIKLRALLSQSKCVAVGEIGLDYYRKYASPEDQKEILLRQLDFAEEFCLPVILHCREAETDLSNILEAWHNRLIKNGSPLVKRPGVLHAFSGSLEMMKLFADRGFYFGIGGPITFKNNPERVSLIQQIPIDRLVFETDAPYLAPLPFRGKRNEPLYLRIIAQKASELLKLSIDDLLQKTTRNAENLFVWEKSFV